MITVAQIKQNTNTPQTMIKSNSLKTQLTKKAKKPTYKESKLIKQCNSDLLKEINKNSHRKPDQLLTDIFNQLIDCLLEYEKTEQPEIAEEISKNIVGKYLLINVIKRINFGSNEGYDYSFASEKTRKRVKFMLIQRFPSNPKLSALYNDKFKKILIEEEML